MTKFFSIFTMTVVGMMLFSLQGPTPKAAAQTIAVESLLRADGTLNLTTGMNGTFDLRGWNVALDSTRGIVLRRK